MPKKIDITPPKLHEGQRTVWKSDARFNVLACGRRWGKSRLGSLMCIRTAIDGGRAWWVAPSYPMASIGWRMIKRLAVQIPGAVMREGDRMVELPTHGAIQVRSADNPDSLRGDSLDLVVMDECAFIKEDAWSEALRPALADRQGRALFISTPKGRNWFWRMWTGADGRETRAWRFTSYDNPYIQPSEIDAARGTLPERIFAQEFMAEFLDSGGGTFRRVTEAVDTAIEPGAVGGHEYVLGVDLARQADWTVVTVYDITTDSVVEVDRYNQIDYMHQVQRIAGLAKRYAAHAVVVETNNAGLAVIEQLERLDVPVVPFTTTNATKQTLIDGLVVAFEQGQIRIPNDPVLVGELQAFEGDRLPSGLMRYGAPAGMHDDCVMSLALARHGATTGNQLLVWGG